MAYRNRRGGFFDSKPAVTREGDKGTLNTIRASPVAQVRLRCNNPVTPHKFKAAYRMPCPICSHGTIEIGRVDGLTKSQGS